MNSLRGIHFFGLGTAIVLLVFVLTTSHANLDNLFYPRGIMYNPDAWFSGGNLFLSNMTAVILTLILVSFALFLSGLPRDPLNHPFELLIYRVPAPVFALVITCIIFGTSQLISWQVFEQYPRDVDHIARIFQAKTFASGRLSIDVPPLPEAFNVFGIVIHNGQMFSKYAPGGAMIFALVEYLFGTSLVINGVLGALSAALMYGACRRMFDEKTARLTLLFLMLSPHFIFTIASHHSHVPAFFFCAWVFFLLSGVKADEGYSLRLIAAGFIGGLGLLTREFTTIVLLAPAVLFVLWTRPAIASLRFAALFTGVIFPVSALLWYNAQLTGSPFLSTFLLDDPEQLPWSGQKGHSISQAIYNTSGGLDLMNLNLLGWPCSVIFIPFAFLSGNPWAKTIGICSLALVIGYMGFFWIDFSLGVRYYFECTPLLLALSAAGFWQLRERNWLLPAGINIERISLNLMVLGFLFSGAFYLPKLVPFYSNDYNGSVNTMVDKFTPLLEANPVLIFMSPIDVANEGYDTGFLANPLNLLEISKKDKARFRQKRPTEKDTTVYARDLGTTKNVQLMKEFPGRNYFIYRFDPQTREAGFTPLDRWGRAHGQPRRFSASSMVQTE